MDFLSSRQQAVSVYSVLWQKKVDSLEGMLLYCGNAVSCWGHFHNSTFGGEIQEEPQLSYWKDYIYYYRLNVEQQSGRAEMV